MNPEFSLAILKNVIPFSDVESLKKLGSSLIIFLVLWIIRFLIIKIVNHQTENLNTRYTWRKGTLYTVAFLTIILVGRVWFSGFQPILTFLGITAAALTISLKEPIQNLAGLFMILWRDIFAVGDRIEISGHKGDVIGTSLFYFTLMEVGNWVTAEQSTGRIIKVPNGLVITNPIINYSMSFRFIWDEISIVVKFESDWKKARKIIEEIAENVTAELKKAINSHQIDQEETPIQYHHMDPKVYMKPNLGSPAGIELTLRYLCKPRQRRDMENQLWESILEQFEQHNIEISHS